MLNECGYSYGSLICTLISVLVSTTFKAEWLVIKCNMSSHISQYYYNPLCTLVSNTKFYTTFKERSQLYYNL